MLGIKQVFCALRSMVPTDFMSKSITNKFRDGGISQISFEVKENLGVVFSYSEE